MINWIMKKSGEKALKVDLAKIDPSRLPENITEIKDIPYIKDGLSGHTFDAYVCKDGTKKPILIDIHGGGFISEDKAMNRMFGSYMASLGFTVFDLNVRIAYPEWTVFDQTEDIDSAVRYVLDHASEYEGDPEQLYIAGHSSGAVLAVAEALLCVDPMMRFDYGLPERSYSYKGIITDCGLLHFYKSSIAYWGMRKMVFPKGYKKDKRYGYLLFGNNNALKRLPRLALLTNSKDVLRRMTFHFDEVLNGFSCAHRLFMYGKDGHTGIIFVPYTETDINTLKQIKDYLEVPAVH
ncbi:MAG: alpha/beta hydrolase [Erysipelotrichaceae bacterium]|nr:alpha/beta hydrolase [Erysipelotrichaceae bacterium]